MFTHIIAPHQPFVFDADGTPIDPHGPYYLSMAQQSDPAFYHRPYVKELTFINARLQETIETILASSKEPPIIVLQSDHGSGSTWHPTSLYETNMRERLPILNAYYFPDGDYSALYEDITPVNTFRVVLNQFFGAKLELLDDTSYFSSFQRLYEFHDVTEAACGDGWVKREP